MNPGVDGHVRVVCPEWTPVIDRVVMRQVMDCDLVEVDFPSLFPPLSLRLTLEMGKRAAFLMSRFII